VHYVHFQFLPSLVHAVTANPAIPVAFLLCSTPILVFDETCAQTDVFAVVNCPVLMLSVFTPLF